MPWNSGISPLYNYGRGASKPFTVAHTLNVKTVKLSTSILAAGAVHCRFNL